MSEKKLNGAKAVIKIGDKVIGEIKNIAWRKEGDSIPMDQVYVMDKRGLLPELPWPTRLIINGEEVPWRR